jgi:hypothetical protein
MLGWLILFGLLVVLLGVLPALAHRNRRSRP